MTCSYLINCVVMFTWGGGGTNVFWHEFCTITECGRETRKRDTLTSNPNPGLVWTNVLCLCIVQILMYILITRLCIIPNVLKDMICTMTMTICGTRSFGKFVWRGCFYRTPCWDSEKYFTSSADWMYFTFFPVQRWSFEFICLICQ